MSAGTVLSQINEATRLKADPILGGTLTIAGSGGLVLESGATLTLAGTGATVLGGALTVAGNASVTGNLAVTGTSAFTGAVSMAAALTITDVNIVLAATTGTSFGSATTQKLSFYGVTPIVQPSGITQTYSTADGTHAARTAAALTAGSGTADGTVDDVTGSHSQTILNNNFKECATQINALKVDADDTAALLNFVIDKLQALGLLA